MEETVKGSVTASLNNKSLVNANNSFYIVRGEFRIGEVISFEIKKALPMPSFMFGLAALNETDLDKTLDYIQKIWFKNNK